MSSLGVPNIKKYDANLKALGHRGIKRTKNVQIHSVLFMNSSKGGDSQPLSKDTLSIF